MPVHVLAWGREVAFFAAVTCEKCHDGELEPTQEAPGLLEDLQPTDYAIALAALLVSIAGVGLALALLGQSGQDLRWALAVPPVVLVGLTPLVIIRAQRVFVERPVWRCKSCDYTRDRV